MAKSSSGDTSKMHDYVAQGIKLYGREGWTTSEIKRKNGTVTVKIKTAKL